MKRSLHRFPFLAAAPSTATDAMSFRPMYRGAPNRPRRNVSDRPHTGGGGGSKPRPVLGAGLGFRHGESGGSFEISSVQNQNLWRSPPPPHFHQNRQFRPPPPPFEQNQPQHQREPYRHIPNRPFSDRPQISGGVGDSQPRQVLGANLGFRNGESSGSFENSSLQNQHFQPSPPQPHFHQKQQFRPPPHFHQSQQFRPPPPPFEQNQPRPNSRRARPPDYRDWEFVKSVLPSTSERFTILSYNLLCDYVALDPRHQRELYRHIPRHMLEWEWRKRNIIFELELWSTDIMCFQEVDRFQDLEEELKLRGYKGIWKRRTGKPIDGCAIFWRASRFKLLHEESIEFNKFGLRDNVAQICVLELMNQNSDENAAALQTSSTGSNKVIVCNIHVLFNPRRGEIKLGQVRILLSRAHAVSKIWNDAPIVLCGDFNCVPKSPIYNFISEQKLNLSGLDRDKLSGQVCAELHARRISNPFPGVKAGDNLVPAPSVVQHGKDGTKQNESSFDLQNEDGNLENVTLVENLSQPQSSNSVDVCVGSSTGVKRGKDGDEAKEETQPSSVQDPSDRSGSTCVPGAGFRQDMSLPEGEGGTSTGHFDGETVLSHPKEVYSDAMETGSKDPKNCLDEEGVNCSSEQISSDEQAGFSGPSQAHWSSASTSTEVQEKLDNLFLNDLDEAIAEEGDKVEDTSTFLSALHDTQDAFPRDLGQTLTSGLEESDPSKGFASALHSIHLSPDLDLQPFIVENKFYDPSTWTPMDFETATGNADCTSLEHHLKLKSSYTEAEDSLGIRDSNGEPLVTSYNRRFLGTVDYIWRSEGLQTVRVLAPIPKHVMQTTSGFPTKKWGSDHIALVSELAFVKDETNHNADH